MQKKYKIVVVYLIVVMILNMGVAYALYSMSLDENNPKLLVCGVNVVSIPPSSRSSNFRYRLMFNVVNVGVGVAYNVSVYVDGARMRFFSSLNSGDLIVVERSLRTLANVNVTVWCVETVATYWVKFT